MGNDAPMNTALPRYRAFLSYSHRDAAIAQRLHRRLETYRVPAGLRGVQADGQEIPARLTPVFRDREELASAVRLSDSIEAALDDSAALIVVCSPHAVASHWVGQEILRFRQRHPERPVLAFVASGDPGLDPRIAPERAALPLALLLADPLQPEGELGEPLAADARNEGDGFAAAFLKLVAGLLGVRYDALRQREARRRQRQWALAVTASLLLSAVMAFLAWDATRARDVARAAQAQAELELESERQTRNFLLSVFRLADAERSHGDEVTVREVLDRAVLRIDSTRFARPAIKSRFLATMGQAYSSLGLHKRSAELLRASLDALPGEALPADERNQRIDSRIELADVLYNMGEYDAATTLLDAVDRDIGNTAAAAAQRARSANVRGDILSYNERDAEAMTVFRAAIAALDAAALEPEEDVLIRSRSLSGMGLLLQYADDHAGSDEKYAEAIALLEPVVGELHPATITAILSRGSNAYASSDVATAHAAWHRALALAQQIYDEDAPEIGTIKNNLGRLSLETGELARAEELLRDALRSDRKHRGASFDDLAYPLNNLALARLFQDDAAEARRLLEEALPIAEKANHAMLGPILTTLAELYCSEDRLPEGNALAERALATTREHDGEDHWHTASALLVSNLCRAAANQPVQRAQSDAALAIVRKRWSRDSPFARHAQALHVRLRAGA